MNALIIIVIVLIIAYVKGWLPEDRPEERVRLPDPVPRPEPLRPVRPGWILMVCPRTGSVGQSHPVHVPTLKRDGWRVATREEGRRAGWDWDG